MWRGAPPFVGVSMSDEEDLLLRLLDRPHDWAARLVYADWLEDHREDALAEAVRLDVAMTSVINRRHRRMQEARLNELRTAHRGDWVELSGVPMTWASALLLFRRRLAETTTWCEVLAGEELRTPQLLPQGTRQGSGMDALWQCRRPHERTAVVQQLGNRRAASLGAEGLSPLAPASDLGAGRLLLFEPERAMSEGG